MPVHSLHIFDRKGKTLFTKRFIKDSSEENADPEQLAEQRKLVFGMLFSLREVAARLSPAPANNETNANNKNNTDSYSSSGLHSVRTGATTLYNYETTSGLRFALYVANYHLPPYSGTDQHESDSKLGSSSTPVATAPDTSVRAALEYIYNDLWIQCVTRSPLYRPTEPNVDETNFEAKLTSFLRAQPWFR